jgi:hypothetical protein
MERRQTSVVRTILLSDLLHTKKIAMRILNNNSIITLQGCARMGTEALLLIDGIGVAIIFHLRSECRKKGIDWNLCEYERNAEAGVSWEVAMCSSAYIEWMNSIIGKKNKDRKDKKSAEA